MKSMKHAVSIFTKTKLAQQRLSDFHEIRYKVFHVNLTDSFELDIYYVTSRQADRLKDGRTWSPHTGFCFTSCIKTKIDVEVGYSVGDDFYL